MNQQHHWPKFTRKKSTVCRDQRPVHSLPLELTEDARYKDRLRYNAEGRETSLALYKPAAPCLSARCAVGVCTTPEWPVELFPETFVTFFTSLDHKKQHRPSSKKAANSSDRTVFFFILEAVLAASRNTITSFAKGKRF